MSAGFCLHCGLKLDETSSDYACQVHAHCLPAWMADQAAAAKHPKMALMLRWIVVKSPGIEYLEGQTLQVYDGHEWQDVPLVEND